MVHLALEDLVQLVLVFNLQNSHLGGWTFLNSITFSTTLLSIVGSVCLNGYHLQGSYREKRNRMTLSQSPKSPKSANSFEMGSMAKRI